VIPFYNSPILTKNVSQKERIKILKQECVGYSPYFLRSFLRLGYGILKEVIGFNAFFLQ